MAHLCLVKTVNGLGKRVVVGATHAAHRRLQASLCQTLGVSNRHLLRASVGMMNDG